MFDIVNLTPHPVRVFDDTYLPVSTIERSGVVARVVQTSVQVGTLEIGGHEISLMCTESDGIVGLPAPSEGVYFVVSLIVAQAALTAGRNTGDLLIPSDLVRDEDGNVIGCRQFAVM